jgi:DNA polymerase I-like protein with 3'-5' exonuclease and polymerase domains
MLNTYVNAWLGIPGDKKHPSCIYDGYIYPEFQQHGTVTGRFSGRAPNPQNIPRADTPRGLLIRGAFSSPEGWCRVVSDYGQIELVMLAHLIGRGKLFEGFLAGIDPHTVHAAGVLGKDPADVTKDERQKYGKTLGFTVINGAHWKKVAELIGGTQKEAKWILDKHEAEFPEVYAFKEAVFNGARSRRPPHVRSLLGRKRRMPGLMSNEFRVRSAAERETFNFLIQGGAADLMKVALIAADNMLAERVPEAYVNMTVHDEMTAMCRIEDVEETKATVIEAMTGPHIQRLIKVPLKVDCNAAQRWSDAH